MAPPPPASGPMPGMGMGMMPGRMGMMQGHMMPGQPGMGGMMHGMEGMGGAGGAGPMAEGSDDPVAAAFAAINRRMHREMAVTSSGDADRDFVAGMIAHHRAAIDMAKLLIGFGKDPELRRLADEIIAAQDAEITQMQAWLERQGQ